MKQWTRGGVLLLAAALALSLSACGESAAPGPTGSTAPSASPETSVSMQTPEPETTARPVAADALFSELKNLEFYFSSGAGGWRTVLHIDGSGGFSSYDRLESIRDSLEWMEDSAASIKTELTGGTLTQAEQEAWAARKEEQVTQAGAGPHEGYTQAAAEDMAAAELTRDRVYQLLDSLDGNEEAGTR